MTQPCVDLGRSDLAGWTEAILQLPRCRECGVMFWHCCTCLFRCSVVCKGSSLLWCIYAINFVINFFSPTFVLFWKVSQNYDGITNVTPTNRQCMSPPRHVLSAVWSNTWSLSKHGTQHDHDVKYLSCVENANRPSEIMRTPVPSHVTAGQSIMNCAPDARPTPPQQPVNHS